MDQSEFSSARGMLVGCPEVIGCPEVMEARGRVFRYAWHSMPLRENVILDTLTADLLMPHSQEALWSVSFSREGPKGDRH